MRGSLLHVPRGSLAIAATLLCATEASADIDNLFVAFGPLAGVSNHEDGHGALVGGEVSGGWLHETQADDGARLFWVGGYADALFDSATDTARVSIGPEVGLLLFGLDGGVVHELGGASRWGFCARVSISVPVWFNSDWVTTVSPYIRGVSWRDESEGHTEIGLLVKLATGR